MTAKRRQCFDLRSPPTPLYSSSPGSITPQSLCTIKSPKFSSKSPHRNNSTNPERDNMVLKFNSKNFQCRFSTTTRDSCKSLKNSTLKDSRRVSSKDKSLQNNSTLKDSRRVSSKDKSLKNSSTLKDSRRVSSKDKSLQNNSTLKDSRRVSSKDKSLQNNSTLKDSRRVSCKDKSLQNNSKTPGEINKSPD
ncbi:hypothetical protein VZT92_003647 [Zoarces viviparus]|uniref:Uncharacterized protein n=1 Tax=Zoarces viviparus TaxID=48416 RepID=A0AAW1FXJ7_ZOAVI